MRLTVGLLSHNSERFAARCLETVVAQESLGELGRDWQIICLDNASRDRIELVRLEKRFPQVHFLREERNLGFSRGHNAIMRRFPAAYHAVLNIDLLLAQDFLTTLLRALERKPQYGSVVGKLLHWELGKDPEKTTVIDSVGIGVTKDHAFFDIGQGTVDNEKYTESMERFGGSAAAVVYRRSALEEIAYERGEFFDETIAIYKEDVDLSYRLLTHGSPCLYVPSALAWHARSVGTFLRRRQRSHHERILSAAHETLLLRKHRAWWPRSIRQRTAFRQFLRWTSLLCLEPKVLLGARRLLRERREVSVLRINATKHPIPFEDLARFFT